MISFIMQVLAVLMNFKKRQWLSYLLLWVFAVYSTFFMLTSPLVLPVLILPLCIYKSDYTRSHPRVDRADIIFPILVFYTILVAAPWQVDQDFTLWNLSKYSHYERCSKTVCSVFHHDYWSPVQLANVCIHNLSCLGQPLVATTVAQRASWFYQNLPVGANSQVNPVGHSFQQLSLMRYSLLAMSLFVITRFNCRKDSTRSVLVANSWVEFLYLGFALAVIWRVACLLVIGVLNIKHEGSPLWEQFPLSYMIFTYLVHTLFGLLFGFLWWLVESKLSNPDDGTGKKPAKPADKDPDAAKPADRDPDDNTGRSARPTPSTPSPAEENRRNIQQSHDNDWDSIKRYLEMSTPKMDGRRLQSDKEKEWKSRVEKAEKDTEKAEKTTENLYGELLENQNNVGQKNKTIEKMNEEKAETARIQEEERAETARIHAAERAEERAETAKIQAEKDAETARVNEEQALELVELRRDAKRKAERESEKQPPAKKQKRDNTGSSAKKAAPQKRASEPSGGGASSSNKPAGEGGGGGKRSRSERAMARGGGANA